MNADQLKVQVNIVVTINDRTQPFWKVKLLQMVANGLGLPLKTETQFLSDDRKTVVSSIRGRRY